VVWNMNYLTVDYSNKVTVLYHMPSCSLATISKKTPSLLTSLATNGLSVTLPCSVML
jgi:hypothetical protein